jgi:uncharacterized protein (UPF0210 family)
MVARLGAYVSPMKYRIRTITAGLHLRNLSNLDVAEDAVTFLDRAREVYLALGYEVQTLRLATQPLQHYLPDWTKSSSIEAIKALDQIAVENNVVCSIGPVITGDNYNREFAAWAVELVNQTKNISFSCRIASAEIGVHQRSIRTASEAIHALAQGTPGGEGNFRFSATAFVPSGTPFFPAAYFDQGNAFSIGLESPNLLTSVFESISSLKEARQQLKERMELELDPIEQHALGLAKKSGWNYLGIDTSPAPGPDASIGQAIEALTRAPFGSPATLAGCATITDVLKGLRIKSCGFSGLMLPVLEDKVLARRAGEGRYGVSELLLYSSVCGTGLDVVPLPGDTPSETLTAVITDVAALSSKYQKALSARLFPIPGKQAGEKVSFDNPFLTDSVVMSAG